MAQVIKNHYGYSEIKDKPTQAELDHYYTQKYYSNEAQHNKYERTYSEAEVAFFNNRLHRKYLQIAAQLPTNRAPKLLDIGCGEGWALAFFQNKGFEVTGLEFSTKAAGQFHPEMVSTIQEGNVYQNLEALWERGESYDFILMDNVLEHVIDPAYFVQKLPVLLAPKGVLCVEVPNDFSPLQARLLENGTIDREFWVVTPDHLSYFNYEGLRNLFVHHGWSVLSIGSDYPIDLNLFNPNTNYVMDKAKGKSVHHARVAIENMLDELSPELTIQLFETFAQMGLGRNLIGYFQYPNE